MGATGKSKSNQTTLELQQQLNTMMSDSLQGNSITYDRSVQEGKKLNKLTEVGDSFTHTGGSISDDEGVTYTKIADDTWQDEEGGQFGSDGMARIIFGLGYFGGTWTHRSK